MVHSIWKVCVNMRLTSLQSIKSKSILGCSVLVRAAARAVGAKVLAYSPLARGHKLDDPSLIEIAERLGCTPAQVAIKFCHDLGCITIPKSSREERIVENLAPAQRRFEQ